MLKKVIGIISYLPDDQIVRTARKNKLKNLLNKCSILFNLPVILVAQNYSEKEIEELKNKYPFVNLNDYVIRLGITGARKALRQLFINSDYDYLIMLDDDIEIVGYSGKEYLKQIENNPDCFIEFNQTLLKLFAISKKLMSKIDYEDISPEKGEGFEDRIFVNKLRKLYPEARREFKNTGLEQHSNSTADELSTWYKNQDIDKMLKKTQQMIDKA